MSAPRVAPVRSGDVVFSAPHWRGPGYVQAHQRRGWWPARKLWGFKVFPEIVSSLALEGQSLVVTNQRRQRYRIDLAQATDTPTAEPLGELFLEPGPLEAEVYAGAIEFLRTQGPPASVPQGLLLVERESWMPWEEALKKAALPRARLVTPPGERALLVKRREPHFVVLHPKPEDWAKEWSDIVADQPDAVGLIRFSRPLMTETGALVEVFLRTELVPSQILLIRLVRDEAAGLYRGAAADDSEKALYRRARIGAGDILSLSLYVLVPLGLRSFAKIHTWSDAVKPLCVLLALGLAAWALVHALRGREELRDASDHSGERKRTE